MSGSAQKPRARLYTKGSQVMADLVITLLAALFVNVIVFWGIRSTFIPLTFLAAAAVLFAMNLLALAAVIYAFSRSSMGDAARLTLRALLISSAVFASVCASIPVARQQIARDVRGAQAFADALMPDLTAHLMRTGLYPSNLAEVAGDRALPRLLTLPDAYQCSGTGFVIQIRIPGTAFKARVYESSERRWRQTE